MQARTHKYRARTFRVPPTFRAHNSSSSSSSYTSGWVLHYVSLWLTCRISFYYTPATITTTTTTTTTDTRFGNATLTHSESLALSTTTMKHLSQQVLRNLCESSSSNIIAVVVVHFYIDIFKNTTTATKTEEWLLVYIYEAWLRMRILPLRRAHFRYFNSGLSFTFSSS